MSTQTISKKLINKYKTAYMKSRKKNHAKHPKWYENYDETKDEYHIAKLKAFDNDDSILDTYALQGYTYFNYLVMIFILHHNMNAVIKGIEKYGASNFQWFYTMAIESQCDETLLNYLRSKAKCHK